MTRGVVKWFDTWKGFGFIEVDGGGDDIFVHAEDVDGDPLRDNDEVSFDIEDDRNGKQRAARVTGGTGRKGEGKGKGFGKKGGKGKGGKPGDWNCPECGFLCFGSKDFCMKCNTPKPRGGGGGRRDRDSRDRGRDSDRGRGGYGGGKGKGRRDSRSRSRGRGRW